jgi:Spy/CpxP family protein refolding chaperone
MTKWTRVCAMVLAVAAIAMFASSALAQPRPGGPGGFGGPGGGQGGWMTLLQSEAVQKELKLLDDQKADLKKIADELQAKMREQFSGMRDLDQEKRAAKMEELRKTGAAQVAELQKKIGKEILTESQVARVKQIWLQVQGVRALSNAEVAADLGLSDAQKKQVEDIQAAARAEMQKLFAGARDMSQEERTQAREKMTASQKQVEEKLTGVLTADQKAKFEKAKGEKFDTDQLRQGRGPGGRGGRGAGGGAQN